MTIDDDTDYIRALKRDYENLQNDKKRLAQENKKLADKIKELVQDLRNIQVRNGGHNK